MLEDGVDVAIGARLDGAGARARGFQPVAAVALGEAQDAEARAIALLGVRAIGEDRLHQGGGLGADRAGPVDQARGRPLEMFTMRLRHVCGIGRMPPAAIVADVGGHALAAMEDLDGGRGAARVDEFVQERMRDGVVVPVDVDVVVDVDPRLDRPVADDEGLGREGMERGLIKLGEELASTGSIDAHDLRVERLQELADPSVEGRE